LEDQVHIVEADLKKAQDRSVEFYGRSTQAKVEREAEVAQPDSARDQKPGGDGQAAQPQQAQQQPHVEDFL